jgi:hypothetical protein
MKLSRERASRKRIVVALSVALILVGLAGAVAYFISRHPVTLSFETEWAIDIYTGPSWARLSPAGGINHPVITKSDIKDANAEFIADPFMIKAKDGWYMFFEVMNLLTRQGDIGCAKSPDGLHWEYQKIVLDGPTHLSYPYVLEDGGQFYMIPENAEGQAIRLYRAADFPYSWAFESTLLQGSFSDTCVFFKDGTWWMLTCSKPYTHDELRLYYADRVTGPWTEHPESPVVRGNPTKAQCGGRILMTDGSVVRFTHEDYPTYGKKLRAFIITELTRTKYAEREYEGNPVLRAQGKGWNRHGMHHLDAHEISPGKWIAVVDGYRKHLALRIEY